MKVFDETMDKVYVNFIVYCLMALLCLMKIKVHIKFPHSSEDLAFINPVFNLRLFVHLLFFS